MPCTCGELFQGSLEGEPCLVSCPIDIYSSAEAVQGKGPAGASAGRKTRQSLEYLAGQAFRQLQVAVHTPLPPGRGYGTSTADIGAALFAVSQAINGSLDVLQAAQIAVRVEPTDSTFFPGLALFDHRHGRFHQLLGNPPAARLFILDPGKGVDSEAYNARDLSGPLRKIAKDHDQVFCLLQQGIRAGDLSTIGEASTLSATLQQEILYNPLVDTACSVAKRLGAAGICRAHSGTIIGLIFPIEHDCDGMVATIGRMIPETVKIRQAHLTGGGPVHGTTAEMGVQKI